MPLDALPDHWFHQVIEVEIVRPTLLDEPMAVLNRIRGALGETLTRRVEGMAIWMGIALAVDWHDLSRAWNSCDYAVSELATGEATRGSRRQGRAFTNPVMLGRLSIRGDLRPIWPLLVLGQTCHVGRGAVSGYGRYRLEDPASWS